MIWLDIVTLAIAAVFVFIGIFKGFAKMVFRFGALALSVVLARIFGTLLGKALFPEIVKSSSIPAQTLENINASIAGVIGTVIVFIVVFIISRLLARFISKSLTKNCVVNLTDRILGGAAGLVFALGAIYLFAFCVNVYASTISLINTSSDIYDVIDSTLIFKYLF